MNGHTSSDTMTTRKAAFAEESAEVEVLMANMDKLNSLSNKIQASMVRLEMVGRTVQEQIGPVHGNTQKLQTTNSNIDRILAAIARVREPLDMRSREDRIIRSAPQRVGLSEYMASLDRTREALREMQQTNLKSNQQAASDLKGLLQYGNKQLEDLFRNILGDGQQSVEPLHYITKSVEFPRLQTARTVQLQSIHAYFTATGPSEISPINGRSTTATARFYAEVRGDYIAVSLQNLAAACIATARKTDPAAHYRRGQNAVGTYAAGMQGIYSAEYSSLVQIFSRDEVGLVLSMTCQRSLQAFNHTMRDLNQHIKEHVISDCFLAYEIVEVLSQCSEQLEQQTGTTEIKEAIAHAMKPIRDTAKSSLGQILSDIRARSSASQLLQLPQDGAAVGLTTDVMERMALLTEYLAPLSSILISLGDGGWSNLNLASSQSIPTLRSFEAGADGRLLFAHYCLDIIETLLSSLQMRAYATLKTKTLQGVFLANSVAIVERTVAGSDLDQYLDSEYQTKIEAWRKKASALYLDAWRDTSSFLLDVQYTNRGRPPSTSTGQGIDSAAVLKGLSSKDKDAIKEKFRSFNTSFDDNVQKHRTYKMEREVQTQLTNEVQRFLDPLYGRFWERYHDIDKGKGKYVKFDKAQFSATLARMA